MADSSRQFPDETVRRFLLGRLSAAEQARFEERLFTDEGLETRVRLGECELADDYAFARLSAADRELFEKHFLVSEDRNRTLLVSGALRDRFPARQAQPQTMRERLRSRLTFSRPALRFAFGALILILLVGTAWLVVKEPQIVTNLIPRRRPVTATPSAPRQTDHPPNSTATPIHRENFPQMPPHESVAPAAVASVVLYPNARETGSIPVVNVPKGEHDLMRFQLSLQPNPSGSYRAQLLTETGPPLFSAESLAADGSAATINFDVPANLLKVGNYEIRITGGSGPNASYHFLAQ
jgi:hypothetical protein